MSREKIIDGSYSVDDENIYWDKVISNFRKLLLKSMESNHDFDFSKPLLLAEANRLIGFISTFDKDKYVEFKSYDENVCRMCQPIILTEFENAINEMPEGHTISIAPK